MEITNMSLPQAEVNELFDFVRLDLPAAYRYLNVISACVDAIFERIDNLQEKEMLVYQVKLAVHETCTNIIDHAYGLRDPSARSRSQEDRIEAVLSLVKEPISLVIDLYDSGVSFNLPDVQTPNQGEVQERGYGLFLIRELMSEIRYETSPQKNHWRLVKALNS